MPVCPVFTCAKNKVLFWDFNNFAVTIEKIQPRMMVAILMAAPVQQSSPATVLQILVKKLTSLPSIMSPPPLFITSRNTTFLSLVETRMPKLVKM